MWPFKKRKFRVAGIRGGGITFSENGRPGKLEWELLNGEDHDIVIYAGGCKWGEPTPAPMSMVEVRRLAQEVADETRFRIDLDLGRGDSDDIWPNP